MMPYRLLGSQRMRVYDSLPRPIRDALKESGGDPFHAGYLLRRGLSEEEVALLAEDSSKLQSRWHGAQRGYFDTPMIDSRISSLIGSNPQSFVRDEFIHEMRPLHIPSRSRIVGIDPASGPDRTEVTIRPHAESKPKRRSKAWRSTYPKGKR